MNSGVTPFLPTLRTGFNRCAADLSLRISGFVRAATGSSIGCGLLLIEELLDFAFDRVVILVAFDVLTAGMNEARHSMSIDQERDARKIMVAAIEPPFVQRAPLRINRDRKFKTV